ncbi:MAG: hypothetical protein RLZZ70_838 [Candidatus Parcubacteria bacterium]|jgi:hypothetical protein
MLRTRDFVLLLLTVAFLVLVGFVGFTQAPHTSVATYFNPDPTESVEFSAEVPAVTDTRAEKLASLRAKLAERSIIRSDEPEITQPEVTTATSSPDTEEAPIVATVQQCAAYRSLAIAWSPQSIIAEDREGMRVYFERGLPTGELDAFGQPLPTPELVRARIPQRTWPLANTSCLPTDVIGIGTDGSLMRNNELALYTVFGGDTLVGYALDGFPIYGQTPGVIVDACGGAMVAGQYRYLLDADRPGLINCFAGVPATIF